MIQAQRQRVESAVTELIDDMDKTHLRKMQVNRPNLCKNTSRPNVIFDFIPFIDRQKCICARQNVARTAHQAWTACSVASIVAQRP